MCGLAGFVSPKRREKTVKKMLEVQAYRGPDVNGVFVRQTAGSYIHMGHNRLSIQDLSARGHQPFVSECEKYIIVFNGEVYNFKSIRRELEALGYSFVSESDTEVVLYSYKEWGMACLEKFIGMFAFAILDTARQKFVLVRDRAGVKPLYYYWDGSIFLFASELKSFHEHPGFVKELNKNIMLYFFRFGYIPAPYTVFKNSFKLEPGHCLEFDIRNLSFSTYAYWSAKACYEQEKFDKDEAAILEELEELLTEAVELRMVADVPVGIFLSGGYDSSLVAALLAKNRKRELHTFTIGFNEKAYNEAEYAKAIAAHLGTHHTEHYISGKDVLDKIETLPYFYDEPFGDSSAAAVMAISEQAKKDVTVILSGDGGDEVFCGYSKYFFIEKFAPLLSGSFKASILKGLLNYFDGRHAEYINALLPSAIRQTNIQDKYNKFKRAMSADSVEEMFIAASSYADTGRIKTFLKTADDKTVYGKFAMDRKLSLMDNMMLVDYRTFMVDDVLAKVDRATMSVSLEGREPLVDHRILEYMARVPSSMKYKNGQNKYLERQILYKYVPKSIMERPKAGFRIPLDNWLRAELKPMVEKYLDISRLDKEIFDPENVKKMKQELFNGNVSNVSLIWFILVYEMWKERWFG